MRRTVYVTLLAAAIFLSPVLVEAKSGTVLIRNAQELNATLRMCPDGYYRLADDIYLNDTGFTPWIPLGGIDSPFNGTLDGNSRIVHGLKVNTTGNDEPAGLFGYVQDGWIHHLLLSSPRVASNGTDSSAGALAGKIRRSNVTDCVGSDVQVQANGSPAGGLVGGASNSIVSNNVVTGVVRTSGVDSYAGGLVGNADNSFVSSLTVGTVRTGGERAYAGGLVGYAGNSPVSNSLATGDVGTCGDYAYAGGLVGYAELNSPVSNSLATGDVGTCGDYAYAGGLVGYAELNSPVSNSLAIGDVRTDGSSAHAGGLVGYAYFSSPVSNSLATGAVTELSGTPNSPSYGTQITAVQLLNGTNGLDETFWNPGTDSQFPIPCAINPAWQDLRRLNATEAGRGLFPAVLNDFAVPGNSSASLFDWLVWNFEDPDRFPIPYAINPAWQDLRRLNGSLNGTVVFPETLDRFAVPGNASESLFDPEVFNIENGYLPFLKWVGNETALAAGIDCSPGGFFCSPQEPEPVPSSTVGALLLSSSPQVAPEESLSSLVAVSITPSLMPKPSTIPGLFLPPPSSSTHSSSLSTSSTQLTSSSTPAVTVLTEDFSELNNWPWWGKTLFGTAVSVVGFTGLTVTTCLVRKVWNKYKYPDGKPDYMQKVYQQLKRFNQRNSQEGQSEPPPVPPKPALRHSLLLGPGGVSSVAEVVPSAVNPRIYEEPHTYETVNSALGAQAQTAAAQQPQEYQQPLPARNRIKKEPVKNRPVNENTYEVIPELHAIRQRPERIQDNVDGVELAVVSSESWYANTHPGVIASAPVYAELNPLSAGKADVQPYEQPVMLQPKLAESGEVSNYFHTTVQLEGSNPFTQLGKMHLKVLARGFDLVFSGMEAVDSYVYDFPTGHPKRTRIHTKHVAETLYGEHLSTTELFDGRIGDMEDPVIGFCNAMGYNVWHAFLVFRNSRSGEYNTLHIRQGSYYPEFMDKNATERYFYYEEKRIVGAISLQRLTQAYGAMLDLSLLRDIFRQRLGNKKMRYRIKDQNCMTFSMLAFWATNFDWAAFLKKTGLANIQSPYHILKALASHNRNHPAIHGPDNNLLPDWLAEINQGEEIKNGPAGD